MVIQLEDQPFLMQNFDVKRAFVIDCVRRWGGASSDAILDSNTQIFSIPTIVGIIGYRLRLNCAFVLGDPVCDPADLPALTKAFHEYCKIFNRSITYISASEVFMEWAMKTVCAGAIEIAEELFIDPHDDPRARTGDNASLLRRKVRRSQQEGVLVNEYISEDPKIEQEIEQIGVLWLKARRGLQIYISHVRLFEDRQGKRWFYAQQGNQIIGVVVLNYLEAYQGWHLNHLMVTPTAPNGTTEQLVVYALEALKKENSSHFVSFGAVPASDTGRVEGFGRITQLMIPKIFRLAKRSFQFHGTNKFWGKFAPQSRRTYLVFDKPRLRLRVMFGLLRALNVSL